MHCSTSGNKMKTGFGLIVLTVTMMSLFGCGPAAQAIKRGDALLETKDHYGASQEYLVALRHEGDNSKAKLKLCENAKLGYEQKLERAEVCEKAADHECALKNYNELSGFVGNVDSRGCLSFSTVNLKQKISEMKSGASEKYYKDAEEFFKAGNYSAAINKYKEALQHNNPYKDSTEKIAESYYRTALNQEKQNDYRNAAGSYLNALNTVSSFKDAAIRATTIYEALADHYLSKKQCRNAYNDYTEVKKIDPQYEGIGEKIARAEECATTKIAFIKFENKTGRDLAGASLNDLIGEEIQAKLKSKASKFLRFMDREQLDAVFAEQNLGATSVTEDAYSFKKLKGVDALIFGKLTQVNLVQTQPKSKRYKTNASKTYECTKYNKKGEPYADTCWKQIDVVYSEVSASVSLTMGGSFKVLKVSSGEQLVAPSFSTKKGDSIVYTTDFSETLDNLSNIGNDSMKNLAGARQDLVGEDELMKKIVDEATTDAAAKILSKLDAEQVINDPVSLKLKR